MLLVKALRYKPEDTGSVTDGVKKVNDPVTGPVWPRGWVEV